MAFKFPTSMIKNQTDFFTVKREDTVISDKVHGFFCSNKYPNSIQTLDFSDISEGDIIIHNQSQRKYYVIDIKPLRSSNGVLAKYETDYQRETAKNKSNNVFNIGYISGNAIIGSQTNATISLDQSIHSITELIKSDRTISNEEKEIFHQMIQLLDVNLKNEIPVQKGLLSKFSDLLHKHQNVAVAVMQMLFQFATTWLK